jgi:hypothetical protein
MTETNLIKSIVAHTCPNCGEGFYIESQFTPPIIGSVFTPEELANAKVDLLGRLETLGIEDEKKSSIIKWVKDESTIFSPQEVESIILSVLKPEE